MHISPTVKEIKQFLTELSDIKMNDRIITIYQGCVVQGIVPRKPSNLMLCGNPKCTSCNMFHTLMKEEAAEFLDGQPRHTDDGPDSPLNPDTTQTPQTTE